MFDEIIGNEQVKSYLRRLVDRGSVGNSLLFAGPDGIGKSLFAEAFAKLIICNDDPYGRHKAKIESGNHPDIRIYRPEGKIGMHSIASMRQLSEEVYLAPYEADRKVFILHDADRMLPYSANALLKTFEEPALDTVIILVSSAPASLLPTVLSRCRTVHFHALSESEISAYVLNKGIPADKAQMIAALAQGSIGNALRLLQEGSHPLRTRVIEMLAKGGVSTYKQLAEFAASIAEHVETEKGQIEANIRTELLRGTGEGLSAVQKQSIEKEVEGAASLHASQLARSLFNDILTWYRDLQLVAVDGNRNLIINRDYAAFCEQASARGDGKAIEDVQEILAEVRISLDRSTSIHICFESLFLKLGLIK